MGTNLEELLERASQERVVHYKRVNGETITFQIGRVVYSMSRHRAGVLLQDALDYHRPWVVEDQALTGVVNAPIRCEVPVSVLTKEQPAEKAS